MVERLLRGVVVGALVLTVVAEFEGCGKSVPNDTYLISRIEKLHSLSDEPGQGPFSIGNGPFLAEQALHQLPGDEGSSAWTNGFKVLEYSYKGTKIIRRGKVLRDRSVTRQLFTARIEGRVKLSFLNSPSGDWRENRMVERIVDVGCEREYEARTNEYDDWVVEPTSW